MIVYKFGETVRNEALKQQKERDGLNGNSEGYTSDNRSTLSSRSDASSAYGLHRTISSSSVESLLKTPFRSFRAHTIDKKSSGKVADTFLPSLQTTGKGNTLER